MSFYAILEIVYVFVKMTFVETLPCQKYLHKFNPQTVNECENTK